MKSQRIGIITILQVNNYGAELQAFALQQKMNLMGYDAEIINYLFYKNKGFRRERDSNPQYPFPFKKKVKEHLLPLYEKLRCLPYREEAAKRNRGFEAFHKSHTKFSAQTYRSYSQLYNDVPKYDVYCVGSDQVWNPGCYTSLNPYFLTFAPEGHRKISYASSFGVSDIPVAARQTFIQGLGGLDHIAVREKTGAEIVKRLIGRESTVVADPTLLLPKEEWLKVAKFDKVPQTDYLLLYVLRDSDYITSAAQALAQKHGLKIVRICKSAYVQDRKQSHIQNILDAAPDDFIGLFSKAKMVLTNSFHGTVFSNIFERDFYSIIPKGKDNNSRIVDLLNRIGNRSRLVEEGDAFKESAPIDWSAVNREIEDFVKLSENYINESVR